MRSWFEQRTRSEKITLAAGLLVVLAAVYYLLLIEPLTLANARLTTQVSAARDLERHLGELAQELAALQGAGGVRANFPASSSLLSVLTTSAHAAGLQEYTKKLAPVSTNAVSLVLDDIPFAALAAWLMALDREQGIEVERVSLAAAAKPGVVSAQLTLKARGTRT